MRHKPHSFFMQEALAQAQLAYEQQEIPVGAVVVSPEGVIIGRGFNRTILDADPSAHAEIQAIRMAAKHIGNHRLPHCRLYVTLEPCMMCLGAILHARIAELIVGTPDPKTGVCGSIHNLHADTALNHHMRVSTGVLRQECADLLQRFFKERRKGKK